MRAANSKMNRCDALAVHLKHGRRRLASIRPARSMGLSRECSCYVPGLALESPSLGQEVEKMTDWLAVVDAYLYTIGGVGAEDALCEACISGRSPEALAGSVEVERELGHRMVEADGG